MIIPKMEIRDMQFCKRCERELKPCKRVKGYCLSCYLGKIKNPNARRNTKWTNVYTSDSLIISSRDLGDFKVKVSPSDIPQIQKVHWYIRKDVYGYRVSTRQPGKTADISVYLMGTKIGHVIDHANGDPLDNRRENLRWATAYGNMENVRQHCDSKQPYKGVCKIPNYSERVQVKWKASIQNEHLGYYFTAEEAARVYDEEARKRFGEYACVNFPFEGERAAA